MNIISPGVCYYGFFHVIQDGLITEHPLLRNWLEVIGSEYVFTDKPKELFSFRHWEQSLGDLPTTNQVLSLSKKSIIDDEQHGVRVFRDNDLLVFIWSVSSGVLKPIQCPQNLTPDPISNLFRSSNEKVDPEWDSSQRKWKELASNASNAELFLGGARLLLAGTEGEFPTNRASVATMMEVDETNSLPPQGVLPSMIEGKGFSVAVRRLCFNKPFLKGKARAFFDNWLVIADRKTEEGIYGESARSLEYLALESFINECPQIACYLANAIRCRHYREQVLAVKKKLQVSANRLIQKGGLFEQFSTALTTQDFSHCETIINKIEDEVTQCSLDSEDQISNEITIQIAQQNAKQFTEEFVTPIVSSGNDIFHADVSLFQRCLLQAETAGRYATSSLRQLESRLQIQKNRLDLARGKIEKQRHEIEKRKEKRDETFAKSLQLLEFFLIAVALVELAQFMSLPRTFLGGGMSLVVQSLVVGLYALFGTFLALSLIKWFNQEASDIKESQPRFEIFGTVMVLLLLSFSLAVFFPEKRGSGSPDLPPRGAATAPGPKHDNNQE